MTWTKDDFEKVYSRYLESGLSVRDFCFNEGINESRFFYWKKRTITSPGQGLQTPEGAFLPVDVVRRLRGLREQAGHPAAGMLGACPKVLREGPGQRQGASGIRTCPDCKALHHDGMLQGCRSRLPAVDQLLPGAHP